MSASARRGAREEGFSLLEVLVAIGVMVVGMAGTAALLARLTSDSVRSRYMSLAATLASEKLEDLNRWPANDPHVAVTSGATAGSLTSDMVQNVTVGASTEDVNYYDEVAIAASGGAFSETVKGLDADGNPVYFSTSHEPDGTITTSTASEAPPTVTFRRRWLIEKDAPVAGVRRVTVAVALVGAAVQPPVTFQMSAVRP